MFYTIYDAIVFKAEKNGIKEEEVRKKLRKRGFTSERLGLLKNNCTTLLTEEILTIIFDEFGLRKLEIDLMLGKVPKEYEESYLSNVSAIADLLKKEEFQKRKAEEKKNIEFKTDRGILYSLIVKSSLLPFAYSFFKLNGGSAKIKSAVSL